MKKQLIAIAVILLSYSSRADSYIIQGSKVTDREFDFVVGLSKVEIRADGGHNAEEDSIFCTGTLVHPRLVITAGHCVEKYVNTHPKLGYGGYGFIGVQIGNEFNPDSSKSLRVVKAGASAKYLANSIKMGPKKHGQRAMQFNDFGYLLLQDEIHDIEPIKFVSIKKKETANFVNSEVSIVGFGHASKPKIGMMGARYPHLSEETKPGIKRHAKTVISSTVGSNLELRGDVLPSNGDSGGPLLIKLPDGEWVSIGIAHAINPADSSVQYNTVTMKKLRWIEEDSGIRFIH